MRCPQCKTPYERHAAACWSCGAVLAAAPVKARLPRPEGVAQRPAPPTTHPIAFFGEGRALFGLHLINLFKTFCTLGLYHFWAKVAVRKYLYAHVSFHGDRFGYHGLGREMLIGWCKVAGIFLAIAGFTFFLEYGLEVLLAGLIGKVLFGVVSLALLPLAIMGANRYRLSRTSWRGIRFSFHGTVREFAPLCAKGLFFSVLTLGLYQPFFQTAVRRYLAEHTCFGTARFGFDGDARALLRPYVLCMLLWVPTGSGTAPRATACSGTTPPSRARASPAP